MVERGGNLYGTLRLVEKDIIISFAACSCCEISPTPSRIVPDWTALSCGSVAPRARTSVKRPWKTSAVLTPQPDSISARYHTLDTRHNEIDIKY